MSATPTAVPRGQPHLAQAPRCALVLVLLQISTLTFNPNPNLYPLSQQAVPHTSALASGAYCVLPLMAQWRSILTVCIYDACCSNLRTCTLSAQEFASGHQIPTVICSTVGIRAHTGADGGAAFEGRQCRHGTPTLRAGEDVVASLSGCRHAGLPSSWLCGSSGLHAARRRTGSSLGGGERDETMHGSEGPAQTLSRGLVVGYNSSYTVEPCM